MCCISLSVSAADPTENSMSGLGVDSSTPPTLALADQINVANAFVDTYGSVQAHIDSFNKYMHDLLPRIISESSLIRCTSADGHSWQSLEFMQVKVGEPSHVEADGYTRKITPNEARLRNRTYTAPVHVDVKHTYTADGSQKETVYRNLVLFYQPIMVGSDACATKINSRLTGGECPHDCNGYFIINGIEKTIMAQERIRTNYPFIFTGRGRYELQAEMRSCHEMRMRSTSTIYLQLLRRATTAEVCAVLPFLSTSVPLGVLFRILEGGTPEELASALPIGCSAKVRALVLEVTRLPEAMPDQTTPLEAREWLAKVGSTEVLPERRMVYINHIVRNEVLPHEGLDMATETMAKKRSCLLNMLYELLCTAMGLRLPDDRDHYANKRVDTAGWLTSLLLRQLFRPYLKTVQKSLQKAVDTNRCANVAAVIHPRKITAGLRIAMTTGIWGTQGAGARGGQQVGVVQILNRVNMPATISCMRRINTPVNKESKTIKPRKLHASTYGVVCFMETPEGASCGLVRNLAMFAYVRTGHLRRVVTNAFTVPPLNQLIRADDLGQYRICVNGCASGSTDDILKTCAQLREARRSGLVPFDVSIADLPASHLRSTRQLNLTSDAGCLMRPLFVVEKLPEAAQVLSMRYAQPFPYLLSTGAVVFVDKEEESNYRVADCLGTLARNKAGTFSHMELHPASAIGLAGVSIPFSDHNQAPRNTYQCAMGKQSVGVPISNWHLRIDSISMTLPTPQTALISTEFDRIGNGDMLVAGQNLIVAIMCYTGFNQEDSLLMNRRSVDMGMMEIIVHRGYRDELTQTNQECKQFQVPPNKSTSGNYETLQESGVPAVGSVLSNGDVIIGKTSKASAKESTIVNDQSTIVKQSVDYPSKVDMVVHSLGTEGHQCVRVRTSSHRPPEVGDKFTSRHGQKGVVGAILPDCDMPFITSGPGKSLQPDIIINPHAIPSRMTVGHLVEGLASKLAALSGRRADGTPFNGNTVEDISAHLEAAGCEKWGNERMYNGKTGHPLEAEIMVTPVYYECLKHKVAEKRHARSRGPIQPLTRQPAEGRARDGGLRMGEMERDCLLTHGGAAVTLDRMFEQSDPFIAPVCGKCGTIGESERPADSRLQVRSQFAYCRGCKTGQHMANVPLPYACKLLFQECTGLNIKPKLFTS